MGVIMNALWYGLVLAVAGWGVKWLVMLLGVV